MEDYFEYHRYLATNRNKASYSYYDFEQADESTEEEIQDLMDRSNF